MSDTPRTDTDRDDGPNTRVLSQESWDYIGTTIQNAAHGVDYPLPEYVAIAITENLIASKWLTDRLSAAHDAEVRRQALAPILALADEWDDGHEDYSRRVCPTCVRVDALRAAVDDADPTAHDRCDCPPCPGRGNDGHGMTHCAECCFGTGVEADPDCPIHGERAADPTAHDRAVAARTLRDAAEAMCADRGLTYGDALVVQWLHDRADTIEADQCACGPNGVDGEGHHPCIEADQ